MLGIIPMHRHKTDPALRGFLPEIQEAQHAGKMDKERQHWSPEERFDRCIGKDTA